MKYYSYISNSKLDMLFPQIPRTFLEDIAGELSVNFGLLKATLKDKALTENRLSKLDAVVKYIEKNSTFGTVDQPDTYIRGVANMYSVNFDEGMVLFCWCNEDLPDKNQYLLLSGSANHVIGMDLADMVYPHSITNMVTKRLHDIRDTQTELENSLICENGFCSLDKQLTYLDDIKHWSRYREGPPQQFEYLARCLITENKGGDTIILATPIFMAMVG